MKKYQLVSLLWLISSMHGQNLVDIRTQTKNVDFSGAASTIPAKSGTALPATCNPGEMFFNTASTPGQNLYLCSPANNWTQLAGGGSGTIATATRGQFAYYAANGAAVSGHTLVASDIPALPYQSALTFTGSGAKTASSTGTLVNNDCAKWDPNGNIIDAGSPCASVASGTSGQFGFYAATGNALTAHTLVASDIPALNYQLPLTFTGSGAKTASSTGSVMSNDCAKWDANGNVIDAGSPCASVANGTTGQFGFYSANGSALTAHTLVASDIPALNYQAPLSFTGTGTKTITSTAAGTSGNCAKWDANGNVVDAGAPCGSGTGSTAFSSLTSSTNTSAALVIGTGASLSAAGSGTIAATSVPVAGVSGLTFSGNTAKAASATGTLTASDCAKWDANGNIIDAGSPCASVASGTMGQFGFYSASGNALTAHTLVASDIPALNYQAPLSFTGTGTKTASSTGTVTASDCAKWDANGNIIDAGSPCASVASGTTGQFGFYSASGNALTAHTLVASDIPALNYQAPLTFTGTGTKTASSTGTVTASDCAKWDANGNVIDGGSPCNSWAALSSGTNTSGALVIGSGSTLSPSGTGTIMANTIPVLTSFANCPTAAGHVAYLTTEFGICGGNGSAVWFGNYWNSTSTPPTANHFVLWGSSTTPGQQIDGGLSASGNGNSVATTTGTHAGGDCASWDANGNVIDNGSPCGSGTGSSVFSSLTSGTNTSAAMVIGTGASLAVTGSGTIAATSVPVAGVSGLTFSGNTTKAASSTGTLTTGDCAKWDANGNIIDAGAPCGSGGGGSSLSTPSTTTVGNVPQYSNTTGSAISTGLGVVTTVGNPGLDTNIPTEKSVRAAIAAASGTSGNLPTLNGTAGYLVTNGTSSYWGDLVTGSSGALCAGTGCSGGTAGTIDIVTSVVPRLAAANTFTGLNKFQQLQVTIYTVATLPTCNSSFEGQMEGVSDAVSPTYLATVTGGGSVHTPVYCNGTNWVAH